MNEYTKLLFRNRARLLGYNMARKHCEKNQPYQCTNVTDERQTIDGIAAAIAEGNVVTFG